MTGSTVVYNVPTGASSGHAHLNQGQPPTVPIDLSPGTSTVIVGANGAGKTRLGVQIDAAHETIAHRISAQRHISMVPNVQLGDYESSINTLHYGHAGRSNKVGNRWQGNPATAFVSDFELLLRALFS